MTEDREHLTTLPEFLLARIAEDDEVAREALTLDHFGDPRSYYDGMGNSQDDWGLWSLRIPPARVLAECDAKRGLIRDAGDVPTISMRRALKWLALPYSSHPDYDEVWRP